MSLTTVLIVLAVIVLVIGRRLAGEPLEARKLLLVPVVLLVIGFYQLSKLTGIDHLALDVTLLGLGGLVALVGGAIRGVTIKIYARDGHLWSRYTWATIVVWVLLIAVRVGQSFLDRALGADTAVVSAALLPLLSLSLLGEAAVVGSRAIRSGTPFAPRKAKGSRQGQYLGR